jgi:hypothetical protein
MKTMNRLKQIHRFYKLLFILFFIGNWFMAKADHILGADFEYKYISKLFNNSTKKWQYKYSITFRYYRTCSTNATGPTSALVHDDSKTLKEVVWGTAIPTSGSKYCTLQQGTTGPTIDLTDKLFWTGASSSPTNCACELATPSTPNAVRILTFSGQVTLEGEGEWYLKHRNALRAGVFANINDVGKEIYIESLIKIDPVLGPNSSPQQMNPKIPVFYNSQNAVYNFAYNDIDNDLLSFNFIAARDDAGSFIPFFSGYSVTNVMGSTIGTPGLTLNQNTGNLTFTGNNNTTGIYNIVVEITETRSGVVVGRTIKDISVQVMLSPNPPDPPPIIGGINGQANVTSIEANSIITFTINVTDNADFNLSAPDFASNLPNSTIYINNAVATNQTATITVNPNYLSRYGNCFTLLAEESNCNGYLKQTTALQFCVTQPPPCINCISTFAPDPGKTYVLSAWARPEWAITSSIPVTYTEPSIQLIFPPVPLNNSHLFVTKGTIIDSWQRMEEVFTVPSTASIMDIKFQCVTGNCLFDDVRIFPVDGSMKSFVYDPKTLRMMAELDERNYATYYEYDQNGKLVRLKKETEKGVMTIQENRTNISK